MVVAGAIAYPPPYWTLVAALALPMTLRRLAAVRLGKLHLKGHPVHVDLDTGLPLLVRALDLHHRRQVVRLVAPPHPHLPNGAGAAESAPPCGKAGAAWR
eukprot:7064440-Prymnesium_polylepis.1